MEVPTFSTSRQIYSRKRSLRSSGKHVGYPPRVASDGFMNVGRRELLSVGPLILSLRGMILITGPQLAPYLSVLSACGPCLELPLHLLHDLIDAEARSPLTWRIFFEGCEELRDNRL